MFQVLIPEAWRMQLSGHLNVLGKVSHSVLIVWRFININEISTIHTELSWVLLKVMHTRVSTRTAHVRLQNLGQETEGKHNIFYRGKMREHKILMNQIMIDYKMSKIHGPNKIVTYHAWFLLCASGGKGWWVIVPQGIMKWDTCIVLRKEPTCPRNSQ